MRVWSKRGSVKAKAVVTKRIRPMQVDGRTVHIVGIPLHWGFTGAARKGFGVEHAHALCRRRQHRDAGIQGVPGGYRARPADRWHREDGADGNVSAIRRHPPLGHGDATPQPNRGVEVAKLIDTSKCIGCKACQVGVPRVERHARAGRRQRGGLRQPADLTPNMFTLMRFTEWDEP